ncbi:MAG TPA: hypothetical protein VEH04_19810 [Verrucomicrobiae bacterium]|nr:hypothetical protein [Verrucomicrobiae bacterium]
MGVGQSVNPDGGEWPVVGPVLGDQLFASGAVNDSGGYLVWSDNSVIKLGSRIRVQRLASNFAPVGAPFTATSAWKSKTAGDQNDPDIGVFADGRGVVAWSGGKNGSQQIYARFLRADGVPLRSDIRVSGGKTQKSDPAVAVLADDSAVVVWSSHGQDGSLQGIYARRYSANGAPLGKEFRVNEWTEGNQRSPAVAALAGQGFVVVWVSELQRDEVSVDIYGRVFDSAGSGGPELLINSATQKLCANPAVAGSKAGGFAVAWSQREISRHSAPSDPNDPTGFEDPIAKPWATRFESTQKNADGWDVYARFYDLETIGSDTIRINAHTFGDQYGPRLANNGNGYFIVWTSLEQDGDQREGVFGKPCSLTGALPGPDVHANTTTISRQYLPAVIANGQDRFLVVWSGILPTFGVDLQAQVYSFSSN